MDEYLLKIAVKNAVKEALNGPKLLYRLYTPDNKIYGTGSEIGSFFPTIDKAKEVARKSGRKDLSIYEYFPEYNRRGGEIMVSY